MKDNMPLHFKWEAEECGIKSENGQVQNRTRASDTHMLANKMLCGVWGLSFQVSAEDDSGLLLKELELILLRRRLLDLGCSLPWGNWQFSVPAKSSLSQTQWAASKSLLVSHKAHEMRISQRLENTLFPIRTSLL